MVEFTGERVIPGQVDTDLWNEHMARYHFARRLSRNRRVLDLACGTGYGAAAFTGSAQHVTGLDISAEAIAYAREHYTFENLTFLEADSTRIPLPDGSFDLITAFELIEHLTDWREMLREARRLLAHAGQFIVSTPNKLYYAETRQKAGPNPFHAHEFTYAEFEAALRDHFPYVSLFVQNHSAGVVFQPVKPSTGADLKLDASQPDPEAAHFFLAVCAGTPQIGGPAFIYLPTSANVLREREQHIARLEGEVDQKTAWLTESQQAHQALLEQHRAQKEQLEESNRWAAQLNSDLDAARERIVTLQSEVEVAQKAASGTIEGYENKIAELEAELGKRAEWAQDIETRLNAELTARGNELAETIKLLDKAEATVEQRTRWAQRLDDENQNLQQQISLVKGSRWIRFGRSIGIGPKLSNS